VACKSCGSERQHEFDSEIAIHFSGLERLDKPAVVVFPKATVCLDCGFTEFQIDRKDLRTLDEGDVAAGT
jgi:hypothetical protein